MEMDKRLRELAVEAKLPGYLLEYGTELCVAPHLERFAELIKRDMYRTVLASILITDVVMEEKNQVPTSDDYITAINKDFGVEE
jgi:hypothetical protein